MLRKNYFILFCVFFCKIHLFVSSVTGLENIHEGEVESYFNKVYSSLDINDAHNCINDCLILVKKTNLAKHVIKSAHVIAIDALLNFNEQQNLPLLLPINITNNEFSFVKAFLTIFNKNGVSQKLLSIKDSDKLSYNDIASNIGSIINFINNENNNKILVNFPITDSLLKNCVKIRQFMELSKCVPDKEALIKPYYFRLITLRKKLDFIDVEKYNSLQTKFYGLLKLKKPLAINEITKLNDLNNFIELDNPNIEQFLGFKEKLELDVWNLINEITEDLNSLSQAVNNSNWFQNLLQKVADSLTVDIDNFISNTDIPASGTSILTIERDDRDGKRALSITRTYTGKEFKKYLENCIKKSINAEESESDVLIKLIITEEGDVVYISTFFPSKSE